MSFKRYFPEDKQDFQKKIFLKDNPKIPGGQKVLMCFFIFFSGPLNRDFDK